MRRIFLVLSVVAVMLLMSTGVALAATYEIKGTSGDDNIRVIKVNKRGGDVINIYCGDGNDTATATVDSGDTVNFYDCEQTSIIERGPS